MSIPGVLAVGIGFPEGLIDHNVWDVGDEESHIFLLRGDSSEHDVQFFIKSNKTGVMLFEGVPSYSKNYNVEIFEDISVIIDFEAVGNGTVAVSWGFRYLDSNSSGLAMDQVVSSFFVLEVDGYVPDDDEQDAIDNYYSGGRSGGGGGAFIPSSVIEPPVSVDVDVPVQEVDVETVQVIDASGSLPSNRGSDRELQLLGDSGSAPVSTGATGSGKGSLLLVGFLFVLTAGLSFVSYKAVKGEEDE